MERTRSIVALAVFAVFAAACGNRLPHQPLAGSGGNTGGEGLNAVSPTATATGIASMGGQAGGALRPGAEVPDFGGSGCAGIATGAPGVTATSIKIGTIVARSGPLPGQFFQMTQAVSSYFQMVNHAGGVCGRKLQLIVQDDGLNADKHLQAAKKLVEDDKVFAIVGMLSAVDKASAGYLCAQQVPDVGGFALSYNRAIGTDCPRGRAPIYWSPLGSLSPSIIGDGQYFQIIKVKDLAHGAVLYHSTLDISKDQGLAQQWALNNAYCRVKHRSGCDAVVSKQEKAFVSDAQTYDVNPVQPESSFDPLVQQMISAGIDSVWSSMEINSSIKLLRSINRNRALWRQKIGRDPVVYFQLSAYDAKLLREAGSSALGAFVYIPHAPFSEPQQPEMSRYLSALARYSPGAQPSSFGVQGWAGAKFFVDALVRAGAALTRDSLRQSLDSFSDYTASGLVGSLTPRDRVIFHCFVVLQVAERNGKEDFYRWFPGQGFSCNPLYHWR